MHKKLPTTTEEKVDAIFRLLTGEPTDPKDEGIIGELRTLKTKLYELINWKNRTVAWAIGVSFGGGMLITFIIVILTSKFK